MESGLHILHRWLSLATTHERKDSTAVFTAVSRAPFSIMGRALNSAGRNCSVSTDTSASKSSTAAMRRAPVRTLQIALSAHVPLESQDKSSSEVKPEGALPADVTIACRYSPRTLK